jgi:N-acetylglucosamine kinase-like BadF-type ATPase
MLVMVIDGGGTKTRAWIVDGDSHKVVGTTETGASNVGRVGLEGLRKVLEEIRSSLLFNRKIDALDIGLAGVGRELERQRALRVAKSIFEPALTYVTSDAELAYRGAFGHGRRGILLIAGTGSIAFYQTPFSREFLRAGGWGPLLGDEGSGAWLGREVMRQCLFEWEGDEFSPFQAAVLEAMQVDEPQQIITKVYHEGFGPTEWATLAPFVFRYAEEHPGCKRVLKRMTILLVGLVERLAEKLPQNSENVPLVVLGGLWDQRAILQPLMEEEIEVRNLPLVFTEPQGGALEGGLLLLVEKGKLNTIKDRIS